jgi:PAS domain S-box-containing protein
VTITSDSARFSAALRAALLLPLAVIGATTLVLVVLVYQLLELVRWTDHSALVLTEALQCEVDLVSSQNEVRGYLLTGDPAYTRLFESFKDRTAADFAALDKSVSDNSEQKKNLEDIARSRDTWLEHARIMISMRSAGQPTNPDMVKMGSTVVEEVRSRFDRFNAREVEIRDSRFRGVRHMKTALAYSGALLVLFIVVTMTLQVRRQMALLAASYRDALGTIEQRHAALGRSERDLEEQKEWLHVTLTSIGDAVIVTDTTGRIVLMNPEAEKLTGWTTAEALHQQVSTVFRLVHEDTRAVMSDPVEQALKEGKVVGRSGDAVLVSRNAEEWPVEDSAAPIFDKKGVLRGAVLVFHDATGLRSAQKALAAHSAVLEKTVAERTTQLQQSVAELEAFSYSVSHDLRSPLRAMQGFSEAVLEDYGDKLDAEGRDYLERIKSAGIRLDRLIQDLLAYSRMDRLQSPLAPLDPEKLVREAIELDANLRPPQATVRVETPMPRVLAHAAPMTQVITNLLRNAVKFVPEGRTPNIVVRAETHGDRVRLWFEDNGIGLAPADRERIFNMFVQLNEGSRFSGTGVGLAIVKKAARAMRGSVGVEAQPHGDGSRFWVELAKG